jgi:ribose transport system permease protein
VAHESGSVLENRRPSQPVWNRALKWASRNARLLAPMVTLLTLVIFFSLTTDRFLSVVNLQNILSQTAPIAIAAAGATFVILCAEIDLSIGTLSVFVGVLAAWFWVGTWKDLGYWSIPVALLVGAAIGYFNGFCVAWIGIPSFMMTLAMLTIAQGLAIYTSMGQPIFDIPDVLKYIGGSGNTVGPIPVIAVIAIVVLLLGEIVLSYTRFGRYVYMTGGNREAAEMSGVNTRQVIAMSLMISGLTAGIAGLVSIGRLGSANPSASSELLITTIAAVVLGGTSLFGGEGGIKNTILGLLIFGVVSNGLNLLPDISIYFKQALQGIILVGALFLNVLALRLERVQTRTE